MERTIIFALAPVDPGSFTGEAYTGLLAGSETSPPTRVYYVSFRPGARTHWHTHSGTQILLVHEGRCLVQREGGPVEEHATGAAVRFAPGERHWHGAPVDEPMVHVAINLESDRTEWMEPAVDGAVGRSPEGG